MTQSANSFILGSDYIVLIGEFFVISMRPVTIALFFLLAINASAYQKTETFKMKGPGAISLNAKDEAELAPTKLERSLKDSLIGKYLKKPNSFSTEMEDLRNSPLYQSYVDEVAECVGVFGKKSRQASGKDANAIWLKKCPLAQAREIAKKQLFLSIKRNWEAVASTIFNDFGEEEWLKARPFVLRKIQEGLIYAPKSKNKESFVFFVQNAGFVEVNRKSLSSGLVRLEIGPTEKNRLEEGAENIRADIDVLPSETESKHDFESDDNLF